jgi:hypothetical protein
MASIYLPEPTSEVLLPVRTHRVLELIGPLLVLAVLAGGLVFGLSWLGENLAPTITEAPAAAPAAVIRPGNGPAVAATVRGRILSLACTLAGPIHVTEDGTGAYVVTSGADNVRCPRGQFHEGFSLRWPAGHAVATQPAS